MYAFDLIDKTGEGKDKEWQDYYELEQVDIVKKGLKILTHYAFNQLKIKLINHPYC